MFTSREGTIVGIQSASVAEGCSSPLPSTAAVAIPVAAAGRPPQDCSIWRSLMSWAIDRAVRCVEPGFAAPAPPSPSGTPAGTAAEAGVDATPAVPGSDRASPPSGEAEGQSAIGLEACHALAASGVSCRPWPSDAGAVSELVRSALSRRLSRPCCSSRPTRLSSSRRPPEPLECRRRWPRWPRLLERL